jgi:hypothetical protein
MACFAVPEGTSAYAETAHADVGVLKPFGVTIQWISYETIKPVKPYFMEMGFQ